MGKKIARVMALLVVLCHVGPIQGGQGAQHAKPIYYSYQESQSYLQVKNKIKETSDTNVSIGKASWYGPGFHGKLTANGEIFDENELTAAHKELPFGTKVLVTNLENGESTIVTINDRGPYVKGRHIDLSRAAAKEVGMIDAGVVDVMMQIVASK
ncbi:MAG: septal ring lytic transglycosylase RlpA family protein [Thermoanaerobacteraceae bacterium]|nr:septal ring lytic transglycosylase RlpA family protein [Thermoanaerobacteraceae bacterium]